MAVDQTDGSGLSRNDRKRHWAYIRVGYRDHKTEHGMTLPGTGTHPVFRWVRVGSPLYKTLRGKGIHPVAVRTGKRPRPGTVPSKGSTGGHGKFGPGQRPDGVKADPTKGGGHRGAGFQGGGGGGKRRRGGRGGGSAQATIHAVDQQIGNARVGQRLDTGMADTLAGQQFDAPIHDVKVLIDRLGPQNAQALADISNWFGQAQAANAQAGTRDSEIANGVADQQDQAVQGLLASLGGSANDGAGMLAAAGLNDSGLQRILGGIEAQSHADMDPLLAQAAASAKQSQQNQNLAQMQNYQLQLADLLGQRGQAKASNLLDIRKYNNDLAQQQFQNMLAKMQAGQAAASLGLDLMAKKADIRAQRAQSKRDSGKFIPWQHLNPAEKTQLLQAAVYKPDGTRRNFESARQYLVSLGYAAGHTAQHNAAVISGLRSYYT